MSNNFLSTVVRLFRNRNSLRGRRKGREYPSLQMTRRSGESHSSLSMVQASRAEP